MVRIVVTILVLVILAAPRVAPAGDEVDYSAPYLVVEDGELVTKYPAKEHEGASPDAGAQASEETESSQQQDSIGAAAIAVAIVLLLLFTRRKRRQ